MLDNSEKNKTKNIFQVFNEKKKLESLTHCFEYYPFNITFNLPYKMISQAKLSLNALQLYQG